MIINLNHRNVAEYKETHKITSTYQGDLKRLVDVEFPDEMEAEEEPPVFDVGLEVDDEVLDDSYERDQVDREGDLLSDEENTEEIEEIDD